MDEKQCRNCQHYLQHFALKGNRLLRVYCGHCIFIRAKRKHPDTKACENFIPGSAPEEAFASKEYLSKELLQHVLNMDLLPEIEDRTANKSLPNLMDQK